jgi:hypothetical protein
VARIYAEGGDLATAAGDVGEAGGAEAGEEAGELSSEKIGREIDEHVFEVDGRIFAAGLRDVGEDFAADGDAFLDDPAASIAAHVCSGESFFDGGVPGFFVAFPAESDASAAVFVAGLQDEVLALCADEREKLDRVAVVLRARVGDHASPRDVIANELLLVAREEPGVLLVGKDGEERLHVGNFAAKGVGHAYRVGFVSFDECGAFLRAGDDVVDEDAAIEQIDLFAMSDKRLAVEFEVARVGEHDGNAHAFETCFQDFEFAPRGDFAPIDDGHLGAFVGAAPVDVAGDEGIEKFGAERVAVRFECAREFIENRKLAENFGERFGVPGAGRSFAVVFGELERIREKKSVEAGRGAGSAVADRKAGEASFLGSEVKLREKRRDFESCGDDSFTEVGDGFGYDANAAFVFGRKEKWAKEWTVNAIAEGELCITQASKKFGGEIRILGKRWPKKRVPVFGRID